MTKINRKILIDTMVKHETLTIDDIAKKENLGIVPDKAQLHLLLKNLHKGGFITVLKGAVPLSYTITDKGIKEGVRLSQEVG